MAPRIKKKRNHNTGQWFEDYLMNYLNQLWSWAPARKAAKKRAQTGKNPETFQCKSCGNPNLGKGEYEVDHIIGSASLTKWDGWSALIERKLEVTADGLQVLCHACHDSKSAIENASRRRAAKDVS
jgi:5-methylcytosine-specific restriction endonuclease McrA